MGADELGSNPPKPRLALTVGIIGHRPNRLTAEAQAKFAAEVENFLDMTVEAVAKTAPTYAGSFRDAAPSLSLVSALAEGADRIAARAALERGFAVDVPLPFEQEICEQDFTAPGSVAEFRDLMQRSRNVLTLPGERQEAERAYENAGMTVLSQSDILLVCWDGGLSAGRGGTADMVQRALRVGIPVVHFDPAVGHAPRIVWHGLSDGYVTAEALAEIPEADLSRLPELIDILVRPPSDADERAKLERFFKERRSRCPVRPEFPLLQFAVGVRPFSFADCRAARPDEAAAELDAAKSQFGDAEGIAIFAGGYGWADALGLRYAQVFRGAIVMNFILGAAAVVLAALSLLFDPKWLFVAIEAILILVVVVNTWIGQWRGWHNRWLETRELAERIRAALPLWGLGVRTTAFANEEPSWTGWYARALTREAGLRPGSLSGDELAKAVSVLVTIVRAQCNYHQQTTAPRMQRLNIRLERVGEVLFFTTLAVAVAYLVFETYRHVTHAEPPHHTMERIKHGVAAISAAFPALATALYGIRMIGDFEGIAERSERTSETLGGLLAVLEGAPVDLAGARMRARMTANAMLGDVANWRLSAESRRLSLP